MSEKEVLYLDLHCTFTKYGFYCGMAIRINRRDWSIQKFQNGRRV